MSAPVRSFVDIAHPRALHRVVLDKGATLSLLGRRYVVDSAEPVEDEPGAVRYTLSEQR